MSRLRESGLFVLGMVFAGLLQAQDVRIESLAITGSEQTRLEFADETGTASSLYEIWRSEDLEKWSLANFCYQEGPLTEVLLPGSRKPREFYRVHRVVQTPGGVGAEGSGFALRDTSFPDAGAPDPDLINLGRDLFWDKELSGNRNISCATCHHTDLATGDALSLPVGEGATGLGLLRNTGVAGDAIHERVPRNAPHIFTMGAREMTVMFHDGRISVDPAEPSGYQNPAGASLPSGLKSALAAQAMFPVTSPTEMAGQAGENEIADFAAEEDWTALWNALAARLQAIPAYVSQFQAVFPDVFDADDITFVHAANAIGAYEAAVFRSDNSPFDRFLRGDSDALDAEEMAGMKLFYGKAGCAQCHSGVMQTDQSFHAIAMPQVGPGKGHGVSGLEDWGRWGVTGNAEDKFRFRTPTLRNVALTGPYGHAGAYATLEGVVRHHLHPEKSLANYEASQLVLASRVDLDAIDLAVMNYAPSRQAIAEANELMPVELSESEIAQVIAFLHALTDPDTLDLSAEEPTAVPSGLPVPD
ncbi:cytochrome-c peroxidase [Roseibacillus persicicus]|uniref:cytochrome-c peroxidase n=1 Tax=Roseibacillus persicicus TaxID=454148 RepID=UPI00280CBFEF|nr:cytochrome c peroxidase [Roseibacillus persicicus]MDQ8191296.1 cytochrome c peroxidase [Roseibacillus persicicus]